MSSNATRGLFNEVDTNHDGKIDRSEFSKWANNTLDEGFASTTTSPSRSYFLRDSYGGASYETDVHTDFDHNVIERRGFVSDEHTVGDTTIDTHYVSRYPTDGRGFYLDPHPEIITRPDPSPAPTYKQHITIRYLQPPPLPPPGDNIIREVRAPPLEAPPPYLIREPGKPGYKPPPLVLRERPPTPPPAIRPVEKTVIIPPLPAPPRSTIIERFPNLPDLPRDIILERWLPYEPRPPPRTIRIAAAAGPLPTPPRNKIIEYQPLAARVVRQFQRLGITRADPQVYIREHGGSLLDSHTFLHEARAHGVVEDISVPTGTAVGFSSTTYGHTDGYTDGYTGSYTGGTSDYIISGSTRYSGDIDTAFRNADTNKDGTLSPDEFDRFVRKAKI